MNRKTLTIFMLAVFVSAGTAFAEDKLAAENCEGCESPVQKLERGAKRFGETVKSGAQKAGRGIRSGAQKVENKTHEEIEHIKEKREARKKCNCEK